ncbi:MAG TPA: GNAT family N-acetyltransferase [Dehalococcoidia bacterium]|jgi:ribosomal protein S18 acetylase RimI-like enzyme
MSIHVRAAVEGDFAALSRLDLTYPTRRYLAIERAGAAPEHTFSLRWREREATDAVYNDYPVEKLLAAESKVDLFLVAEADGVAVGLLMVMVPAWTDAAEITDLAVDRRARRVGAGKALVEAATAWALERGYRALWVEPRADNEESIEFYLRTGFRLSGFNDRLYSDEPAQLVVYMHLEIK